jgi:hypothetical protein
MASFAMGFALIALCAVPGWSAPDDPPEDKGRAVLNAWLARALQSIAIKIEPKVIPVEDENIQQVFPGDRFYGVYVPRWPVAIRPPKELSYETVVCIRQDESVEPIRDEEALRTFLAQRLLGVQDETRARAALLASLRLAEAGAKGGPYQFEEPEFSVVRQEKSILATARAAVHEPGRGEVEIRMEFGSDGRINSDAIKIGGRPRPGPPGP